MTTSETVQYGKSACESPSTGPSALLYLLIGGCIGAAAALLFAPKAGTEVRSDISRTTKRKYNETLEAANRLKQKTSYLFQAKDKKEREYEFAEAKIDSAPDTTDDAFQKSSDHVNGDILEISSRPDERLPAPPSSNIV